MCELLLAHRVRECQHLTAVKTDRRVDQRFQTESFRKRRDEQQPDVRDEVRVIEGGVDPVERVRYSRPLKKVCPFEVVVAVV